MFIEKIKEKLGREGIELLEKSLPLDSPDADIDPRVFWINSLLELPDFAQSKRELVDLIDATKEHPYPGYVLEKVYYACSLKKLESFRKEIFDLTMNSVKAGYKPESTLYWLRMAAQSDKINEEETGKIVRLAREGQKNKLKPEFVFYELWGFAKENQIGSKELSKIVEAIRLSMQKKTELYSLFHWLRVCFGIFSKDNAAINHILDEVIKKLENSENPLVFLRQSSEQYFKANHSSGIALSEWIVKIHTF